MTRARRSPDRVLLSRSPLALVALLALGEVALGQDALGDGRADTSEIDNCRGGDDDQHGDLETLAYEHYERGRNLYEQGDYEAAIEEFALAYCHKPTASVLQDIAQSFERLVNYEKAVAYLRRFIKENPDDQVERRRVQTARVQVLERLPARIRITTVPENVEAIVTLSSTEGVRRGGFSNDETDLRVPKGTYRMTIESTGFQTITETIEVKIGQPYSFYYQLRPQTGKVTIVAVPETARLFVTKLEDRRSRARRAGGTFVDTTGDDASDSTAAPDADDDDDAGNYVVAVGSYVENLAVGTYAVTAEANGRVTQRREINVTAGSDINLTIDMPKLPRSGRTELLVAASLGGVLAGAGTFTTLFEEDTERGSLSGLLGLGLGFGTAYLSVPDDISVGHSSFIIGSSVIGLVEGTLLSSFFLCDSNVDEDTGEYRYEDACEGSLIAGTALLGGTVGLVASTLTAGRLKINSGDAALINSGALWGSISGAIMWSVFNNDARLDQPLLFGGLNLGVLTGVLLSRRYDVSRGHIALIDLSGLVGMAVGVAFVDVAELQGTNSKRIEHSALLGMTLGLLTGTYLTRHMDEPKSLSRLRPNVGAARDASGKSAMTFGLQTRW